MTDHTALLTGIHRGGTTLTCELLDTLPDTVALDEPVPGRVLGGNRGTSIPRRILRRLGLHQQTDPAQVVDGIEEYLDAIREQISTRRTVETRHVDGEVIGAKVGDERDAEGIRVPRMTKSEIQISKNLSPRFMLVVKHNSAFTALLPALSKRFPVFAIVRNPLAALCSWQTVPFSVNQGRIPYAEKHDPALAHQLDVARDRVERQLIALEWFFGRFAALDPSQVVRYEDIVATGGAALALIVPAASGLRETLENRNRAAVYEPSEVEALGERLLARDGPQWNFYSRQSVRDLIDARHGAARDA
jgi:hypothetical protein